MTKTPNSRIAVLETRVDNLKEDLDEIKTDIKDVHDCLDRTRDELKLQLTTMYDASCSQHAELAKKISALESLKNKWTYMLIGGSVVFGWAVGHSEAFAFIGKLF